MSTTAPLLNKNVINTLIIETSCECMPMMLEAFCQELAKRRTLLAKALNEHNLVELTEQAHAIKSCAGTFGASQLYDWAKTVEQQARTQHYVVNNLQSDSRILLSILEQTEQQFTAFRLSEFS